MHILNKEPTLPTSTPKFTLFDGLESLVALFPRKYNMFALIVQSLYVVPL